MGALNQQAIAAGEPTNTVPPGGLLSAYGMPNRGPGVLSPVSPVSASSSSAPPIPSASNPQEESSGWQKALNIGGMAAGLAGLGAAARLPGLIANPLSGLPPRTPTPPGMAARGASALGRAVLKPFATHPATAAIGGMLYSGNTQTDEQEMAEKAKWESGEYSLPEGYTEATTPEERGQLLADPDWIKTNGADPELRTEKPSWDHTGSVPVVPGGAGDSGNNALGTGTSSALNVPDNWTRTITQSATDPGREIAAYSNGKGSWMTGERDVGTGGGTFSVIRGPGSNGMSTEEWDALPNEEKISRNVAAIRKAGEAQRALAYAKAGRTPPEMGGDGGYRRSGGYESNRSRTRTLNELMEGLSGEIDTMGGKANVLTAKGLMMQRHLPEVFDRVTGRTDAATAMDWQMKQQNLALERQKAIAAQANADRTYGVERDKLGLRGIETDLKKAEYVDEFRQNFRERFHLPNAPTERLAQDAIRISQETGMSPYDVQQKMAQELAKQKGNGKKFEWNNEEKYNQFLINVGTQQ
jgi:hypothetical protein